MRVSYNWLKKYIDISVSATELAESLTMAGLEVENIDNLGDKYKQFVVGEVIRISKHPNADKLSVCSVNVGSETIQIICGASNIEQKHKVPVALPGASIPHNQHDPEGKPFVLSNVKVRGVDSFGMICSPYELDFGDDKNGIMILDDQAKVGTPLAEYFRLDDVVFDVSITPNRPDAMSHFGIAREIKAILGGKLKIPSIKLIESKSKTRDFITIKILDRINCPRYTSRVILGVTIKPSPQWIQDALQHIGIRPINNIVDITNYVLMEIGHPLHAFDYDIIKGKTIIVKCANEGERFVTLDEKERVLNKAMLMICDGERSIAIAGVMGGRNSEISNSTKNIVIESAYFRPQSVRRTSKTLGITTEASQRFERGADPNITEWAVNRAATLVQAYAGGEILRGVADIYPKKLKPLILNFNTNRTNEILGTNLKSKNIIQALSKLEIKMINSNRRKRSKDVIKFRVPTFRTDLTREIDLIEEVGRIYGYDRIEAKERVSISLSNIPPYQDPTDLMGDWLIGRGYNEIICNSLQEKKTAKLMSQHIVEISNPVSQEMSALRTSLIPGVLEVIRKNIFFGSKNLRLFEFGKVYFQQSNSRKTQIIEGYTEEDRLLLALTGALDPQSYDQKLRFLDIFDIKGEIQDLFKKIFLDKFKFIHYSTTNSLTQHHLLVHINGEEAGYLGNVRKDILKSYEIEQEVYISELFLDVLVRHVPKEKKYLTPPKYPSVTRDIAIVVNDSTRVEDIENVIRSTGAPLLTKLELFDVYRGNQIAPNEKSCAFTLEFSSPEQTLTQEMVDRIMDNIIEYVSRKLHASIRR